MRSFLWPFALVALVAVVMMLLGTQVEVIDQDETIYALVALDLLAGKLPYEGVFDHKPLGVYYLYAAVLGVFGEGFFSIRIMSIFLLIGTAANLFFGLSKLGFNQKAKYAAAATAIAFPIGLSGLAGNTEIIQNFCLSAIFLLICYKPEEQSHLRRFLLLAAFGALVAIGFSINYLFSFLGLFSYFAYAAILLFLRQHSIVSILVNSLAIFFGFVVTTIIIYAPYLVDLINGGQRLQSYLTEQQEFLSSYRYPLNKQRIIERLFVWVLPFSPILVGGCLAKFKTNSSAAQFFAISTLAAASLAAFASLSLFHHYWILACVPIALLAAVCFQQTDEKNIQDILRFSLCGALIVYLLFGSEKVINHHLNGAEAKQFHAALRFIDKEVSPEDRVISMQISPAYAFVSKLNIDQKFVFPNHVPKLANAGLIDPDAYYLDMLNVGADYVLANPNTCEPGSANQNRFAQSCDLLASSFSMLASFQGYYPVAIYKYVPEETARSTRSQN